MHEDDWVVGFHAVLGALESGRPVEAVWLQKGRRDSRLQRVVDAARSRGVAVRWVPRARLDGLSGSSPHNGCAARCGPVALARLDDVLRPEGSDDRVVFYEVYDTRAAFDAHLETAHLARFREAFPPLIVEELPVRFAERTLP